MMFIGVIGAMSGIALLEALGATVKIEGGLGLAFFISLIYTTTGAYIRNKMTNE